MKDKPVLTIIIATLNSGELLPKVLESVSQQDYPLSTVEILVIDGGSTDTTLEIAKKYNCKIIFNPKMVPAWAKYLGYLQAQGKYAMFLDSDEVIENIQSIKKKIDLLTKNPSVGAVTGSGYKSPRNYGVVNNYINEYGDPFSFFIYKLSKDFRFFIPDMKKNYTVVKETKEYLLFDFSTTNHLPIFELVAMGSIVNLDFLKKNFPEIEKNPGLIPHFFNLLLSKKMHIGITKNDVLVHYSSQTLKRYLGKISSRIVNNIYTKADEGFKGRNSFSQGSDKFKQYLFIPYAYSIIIPLCDALWLSITRKNLGYLIHLPLCLYTAWLIMYYMGLNVIGIVPELKSYGGDKKISGL